MSITTLSPDVLNAILVAASWIPGELKDVMRGMDMGTVACTRLLMCGDSRMVNLLRRSVQTWRFVLDKNNSVGSGVRKRRSKSPRVFQFTACADWQAMNPRLDQFDHMHTVEFFVHEGSPSMVARKPKQKLHGLVSRLVYCIMQNPPKNLRIFRIVSFAAAMNQLHSHLWPSASEVISFARKCPKLSVLDVDVRLVQEGFENQHYLEQEYTTDEPLALANLQLRQAHLRSSDSQMMPSISLATSILSINCTIAPEWFPKCSNLTVLNLQRSAVSDDIWPFLVQLKRLVVDHLTTKAYYHLLPRSLNTLVCGRFGYSRKKKINLSGLPDEEPNFPPGLEEMEMPNANWLFAGAPCLLPRTLTTLSVGKFAQKKLFLDDGQSDMARRYWLHGCKMADRFGWHMGGQQSFRIDLFLEPPVEYPHSQYLSLANLVDCDLSLHHVSDAQSLSFVELKNLQIFCLRIWPANVWQFNLNHMIPTSLTTFILRSQCYPPSKIVANLDEVPNLKTFEFVYMGGWDPMDLTRIKFTPPMQLGVPGMSTKIVGINVPMVKIHGTQPTVQTGGHLISFAILPKIQAAPSSDTTIVISARRSHYVGQFEFLPLSTTRDHKALGLLNLNRPL